MRKFKHAIIHGAFDPLHAGHLFVIDVAMRLSDKVSILLFDTPKCAWPVAQRLSWLVAERPSLKVIPIDPDDLPTSISKLGADVIFGSDQSTHDIASQLNITPYIVDRQREIIAANSAMMRQDLSKQWAWIAPAARKDLQKRVCFLGPESVGKTSLAKNISSKLGTIWCPEYGRIYTEEYKAHDDPWYGDELIKIAQGHLAYRQSAAPQAGYIFVEDTDVIQTIIWSEYLLKSTPDELNTLLKSDPLADHFYLLSPDVAWLDDGVRYHAKQETRKWFFAELEKLLKAHECSYTIVTGANWDDREETVLADLMARFSLKELSQNSLSVCD